MLPERVQEATLLAARWVKRLTDDWCVVKAEIMGELDNEHRKLFSRRDQRTKEVFLNAMEQEVVELWERAVGVRLEVRSREQRRGLAWWDPEEAEKIKRRKGRPPRKRKEVGW